MKKLPLIAALLLVVLAQLNAQRYNQIVIDKKIDREILYGSVNLDAFTLKVCESWFPQGYDSYKISKRTLTKLQKQDFSDVRITIIIGSWCSDCQREIPRFVKIIKSVPFPAEQLNFYAINTNRETIGVNLKKLNIVRIPTIIVYRNDEEIGRIVERPKHKLEKEILKIVLNNNKVSK